MLRRSRLAGSWHRNGRLLDQPCLASVASPTEHDRSAVDLCAGDVNVFPDASIFPESSSLVGRDELRRFLEETWAAWASAEVTPTEVLNIGDGRVLVRADWGGTGSASGVETHTNLSAIYTIRDGHISRAEWFLTTARLSGKRGWRSRPCRRRMSMWCAESTTLPPVVTT
jgi:ketosteroid isomerase-like protein